MSGFPICCREIVPLPEKRSKLHSAILDLRAMFRHQELIRHINLSFGLYDMR